jgi:hypothetical protein
VQIDRAVSASTGSLVVGAAGSTSDVRINAPLSASGPVDISAGRDLRIDAQIDSSGMVALDAGRDLIARSTVSAGSHLLATAGERLNVEDTFLYAGETAIILTGSLNVLASEAPSGIFASSDLGIAASGPAQIRGGSSTGASAVIANGAGEFILTARGLTLAGGSGPYASAQINGNPDVFLTLTGGGSLALLPGTGFDAYARVNATVPTTIYLDLRGSPPGGFSVAGVSDSVYHEASGSGLYADGIPAVRAESLRVSFNGLPEGQQPPATQPPIDPGSLIMVGIGQSGSGAGAGGSTAGGSGPGGRIGASSTEAAEGSTEEGTTILLLRPRPPALCN